MKLLIKVIAISLSLFTVANAAGITGFINYSLEPASGMLSAELAIVLPDNPIAILILVPSCNGDGRKMLGNHGWIKFAEENSLALVGLSFTSDIASLHNGTGYYYASKGSGQTLLDALDHLTGKQLPLLLYGFSGGAHFTSRFSEWKPERVIAWCAYSAGWWDAPTPSASVSPFGIIACGEYDSRLGASLFHFKAGRAIGKPWLWLEVPNSGHEEDQRVAEFAQRSFATILNKMQQAEKRSISQRVTTLEQKIDEVGGWVDIEDKEIATQNLYLIQPALSGWLPDMRLFPSWRKLVKPDKGKGNGHE